MKASKNIILLLVVMANAVLFTGCKRDEISSFTANPAINFDYRPDNTKMVQYSFLGNPESTYTQYLNVLIVGDSVNYDRHFKAQVVTNDTSTTATPAQYEILDGIVEAGSFSGKIPIKLKNSTELSTKLVSIKIKLIDSEDFKAGNLESQTFIIKWTNQILVPSWTYYRFFFTSVASKAAYRIIVETTGLKSFTAAEYRALGATAAETLGTKFGDYVKQWNKDHPNDILKHDDGTQAGQPIVPLYYTHSKFD